MYDVGEQAAVDVAALDPEDQPHRLPLEQAVVEARRLRPEALTGASGLTVSGVSTPISRTSSTSSPICASTVSPSTTRVT